jgi:hypothetical protein
MMALGIGNKVARRCFLSWELLSRSSRCRWTKIQYIAVDEFDKKEKARRTRYLNVHKTKR